MGARGLEPRTFGLKDRRSTYCATHPECSLPDLNRHFRLERSMSYQLDEESFLAVEGGFEPTKHEAEGLQPPSFVHLDTPFL